HDPRAELRETIGGVDRSRVVAQLDQCIGEVRPVHEVVRLDGEGALRRGARLAELVHPEQHPGPRTQRAVVGRVDGEGPLHGAAGVQGPSRVAGLARLLHGAGGLVDQLPGIRRCHEASRGEQDGERRRRGSSVRQSSWHRDHDDSPGSTCRRFRPSNGLGRKGKSAVMPFSFQPTPSPTKFWMKFGPPATRTTMSVTSSFGRRPFGKPAGSGVGLPAASWARIESRLICAGGVGGTVRSSRSSSEKGPTFGSGFCPAYLRSSWTMSSRGVGGTGTPETAWSAAATSSARYASRNCASSAGSTEFQKSLRPTRMMSSFTSGLAMRDTWRKSFDPLSSGLPSFTGAGSPARMVSIWRDVLA